MEEKEKLLLTADDVAEILQIKKSHAYSLIRERNKELTSRGKLVIRGRINRKFLEQKLSI